VCRASERKRTLKKLRKRKDEAARKEKRKKERKEGRKRQQTGKTLLLPLFCSHSVAREGTRSNYLSNKCNFSIV
jgi:hypothetical protein